MNNEEKFVDVMIGGILASHLGELTIGASDLGRNPVQYPSQLVRRTAAVFLAFGLIIGLLPGCANSQAKSAKSSEHDKLSAATIVPLDGPVLAGKPVTFMLSGNLGDPYWELGDGAKAEGPSVNHTYQQPGIYRVVMGSKVGDTFKEVSSAIVRVHAPETLHLPQVILDTDARNEIDDQHYIGYGLFSNLDLLGINSIHHGLRPDHGGHAQEQINFGEIHYIIQLSRASGLLKHRPENLMPPVFHGAKLPLQVPASGKWQETKPVKNEASEAILAAARGASPDNPVWYSLSDHAPTSPTRFFLHVKKDWT
ncbi:PKD domain-containing protein [Pararhodonellum marinum]|uniref:PKD domain-containing protein n=1 Tax=Pararhodonellum marinum TaxID=2755358 RepID=UPI00188EED11|nr:PKD domain-containing protein [Pararhodonellum marinum]